MAMKTFRDFAVSAVAVLDCVLDTVIVSTCLVLSAVETYLNIFQSAICAGEGQIDA